MPTMVLLEVLTPFVAEAQMSMVWMHCCSRSQLVHFSLFIDEDSYLTSALKCTVMSLKGTSDFFFDISATVLPVCTVPANLNKEKAIPSVSLFKLKSTQ